MSRWEIVWRHRQTIVDGLENTLILFAGSSVTAFLLGCLMALLIQTCRAPLSRVLRGFVDGMRMLPFLIYAYVLYYGLPSLGVRFDAWTAGFLALITYHAAYFAEILRGSWATLPVSQAEAARACGFTTLPMYRRIILPQLVLRSAPVLGNQLIICLKDTAFLMIITVRELTASASAVQSTYFVPFEAFVVAIGLYWLISASIEGLVMGIGLVAERRGLGYGRAVARR
jgi:polar amino acid transport system permease protein